MKVWALEKCCIKKTVGAMIPDKSGMLFKVNVHSGMKEFVRNNPTAKAIYAVNSAQLYAIKNKSIKEENEKLYGNAYF